MSITKFYNGNVIKDNDKDQVNKFIVDYNIYSFDICISFKI